MADTFETKVHHLLAAVALTKINGDLVSDRSTIDAIQVTSTKNDIGLLTFNSEVHQHVIERLFNVGRVNTAYIEVIGGGSPLRFSSAIKASKSTSSRIIWDKRGQSERV